MSTRPNLLIGAICGTLMAAGSLIAPVTAEELTQEQLEKLEALEARLEQLELETRQKDERLRELESRPQMPEGGYKVQKDEDGVGVFGL